MNDLEKIGQLYINWLDVYKEVYHYERHWLDLITNPVRNINGEWEDVFDPTPIDFTSADTIALIHKKEALTKQAVDLYKQLLEAVDDYKKP